MSLPEKIWSMFREAAPGKPSRALVGTLLFFIFIVSLSIRTVMPYDSIFNTFPGVVRFGGNDPWYHMQLAKNLLYGGHFPYKIFFDAYTYYPYGTYIHFGPLFTWLIAICGLVAGFVLEGGVPSPYLLDTVGAYIPAFLGALTSIPVYFLAKWVFDDKRVGVLSALIIAFMPGQFLSRSILGFTDHHIAESLLMLTCIAMVVLYLKTCRDVCFEDIRNMNWGVIKKPILYSILIGIAHITYLFTWPGALMFSFIIAAFALIQYTADHLKGVSTDYLCIMGLFSYVTSSLLYLTYLHPKMGLAGAHYSMLPLLVFGVVIATFLFLSGLSWALNKMQSAKIWYPISLAFIGAGTMLFFSAALPEIYRALTGHFGIFSIAGGQLTIAEASPIFSRGYGMVHGNFAWYFIVSIIAIFMLGISIVKSAKPEKVLLLIWCLFMLFATISQNRFAYYYAVNAAVLGGYFSWRVLDNELIGFGKETKTAKPVKSKIKRKMKSIEPEKQKGVPSPEDVKRFVEYNRPSVFMCTMLILLTVIAVNYTVEGSDPNAINIKLLSTALIVCILLFILAQARFKIGVWHFLILIMVLGLIITSLQITIPGSRYGGGPNGDWYYSLVWLGENTPDPGLDYYGLYMEPDVGGGWGVYPYYPNTTYGVISWWDYGHWIECIGRRIPNANPFQQGIGTFLNDSSVIAGAAPFFTTDNETLADSILDELDTRYVVSDIEMATGKFYAMGTWGVGPENVSKYFTVVRTPQGPQQTYSDLYYRTMEARQHVCDGMEVLFSQSGLYCGGTGLKHYRLIHESPSSAASLSDGTDIKYVKTFEYVKGANIIIDLSNNSSIDSGSMTIGLMTNQGREFNYAQSRSVIDNKLTFTVPYSTEGAVPGGTQFAVLPTIKYVLSAGNITMNVSVNEKQVMNGEDIYLSL